LDILAAEDTPSDVDLLEMALKKCGGVRSLQIVPDGHDVVAYLKGESPFDEPRRQVPNIVFMDLKMPRLNGFEVLEWLRKHPDCSVIPVIIMSSSAMPEDILRAYRLGANAYFQKPMNFHQLQDVLQSILKFWSHAERPPITKFPC
jgi:CheY-like chemotaxis protein